MSTGLNCLYFETEPGKWYYALEQWNAPKDSFNWMEYADFVGPFPSLDKADEYLHKNNPNPGGFCTESYESIKASPITLAKRKEQVKEAQKPITYRSDLYRRTPWH